MSHILALWNPINVQTAEQTRNGTLHATREFDLGIIARTVIVGAAAFVLLASMNVVELLPPLAPVVAMGAYNFEYWRASCYTYQLALQVFRKEAQPSSSVMDYIMTHPKALAELAREPSQLGKVNKDNGRTFSEEICSNLNGICLKEKSRLLESLKILAKVPGRCANQQWIAVARHLDETFIDTPSFDKQYWSSAEQFALISRLKNGKALESLVRKGWDINVANAKGNTVLKETLLTMAENLYSRPFKDVIALVLAGAQVPDLDEEVSIKKGEQEVKTTLREAFKEAPILWAILNQKGLLIHSPAPEEKPSVWKILKPAIDPQAFSINHDARFFRMMGIFLAVHFICLPLITIFSSPLFGLAACSLPPLGVAIGFYRFESDRSAKKLNAIAIKELEASFPSPKAMKWIVSSRAYVGPNLGKISLEGTTIFEELFPAFFQRKLPSISFFEQVVDSAFHAVSPSMKVNYFLHILSARNTTPYIKSLLNKSKVNVTDFTPEQQVKCWNEVEDSELAQLLVQKGFDVNVPDSEGKTPLYRAVERHSFKRTRALLAVNADKTDVLKASEKGESVLDQAPEAIKRLFV